MERDNEVKGVGNSLDFGARMYDSRLGRFLSLDPLASKFPDTTPYSFAGDNPILNVDKEGKIKTTYLIIHDEKTDKSYVKTITSPGLVARSYSLSDGYGVYESGYDWYDSKQTINANIDRNGTFSITSISDNEPTGSIRTSTYLKSEGWAKVKVGESIFDKKEKDKGFFAGWQLYSKGASGEDNKYNPRGASGSKSFDVGPILQMFGRINNIKGSQGVDGVVDLINCKRCC